MLMGCLWGVGRKTDPPQVFTDIPEVSVKVQRLFSVRSVPHLIVPPHLSVLLSGPARACARADIPHRPGYVTLT